MERTGSHDADKPVGPGEFSASETSGPRRLSLRANFSWTFAGQLAYTAAQLVMVLILGKFGAEGDLGLYVLGQAVCLPINWLTSLNLRAALVTDARNTYSYGQYVGLRVMTASAMVLIALAVAVLGGYGVEAGQVIVLTAIGYGILAIREIVLGVVLKNECMNLAARSALVLAALTPICFGVTFVVTRSLVSALIVLVLVRFGLVALHDIPAARKVARSFAHEVTNASLRPVLDVGALRHLAILTLPLGLAMTLSSLSNSVPVFFLEHHHGKAACDFYGVLAMAMTVSTAMMNTLGTAATPRLAKYFLDNRRAFIRLMLRLLGIGACIGVVGVGVALVIGRPALELLFKPSYGAYAGELAWMLAAAGVMFMASFLISSVIATRAFRTLLACFAVIVVCCIALAAGLVKPHGVAGAVWTRLGSSAITLIVLAVAVVVRLRRTPAVPAAAIPVEAEH